MTDNACSTDYSEKVTFGFLADVILFLGERGIELKDNDPRRLARALGAVCDLVDAVAGPL